MDMTDCGTDGGNPHSRRLQQHDGASLVTGRDHRYMRPLHQSMKLTLSEKAMEVDSPGKIELLRESLHLAAQCVLAHEVQP